MSPHPPPAPDWARVGRLVARMTAAGPTVSTTGAAVSAARLRRAAQWSDPMLERLSGLEDASRRVARRPVLVVDRRGCITVCAAILDDVGGPRSAPPQGAPSSSIARRPRTSSRWAAGALGLLSVDAPRLLGLWDPTARRRVLVAPNVLVAAELASVDQTDQARWVALGAGLRGVLFEQAPWLKDRLSWLARRWPADARELEGLLALIDQLLACQMDRLTPRDISSAGWIRAHASESTVGWGLTSLRHLGVAAPDRAAWRARARGFACVVVDSAGLATLLRSPDHLPTARELDHPDAWLDRVGR